MASPISCQKSPGAARFVTSMLPGMGGWEAYGAISLARAFNAILRRPWFNGCARYRGENTIGTAAKIMILSVAALLGSVELAWSAEYGTVEDLLDHNEQYQAAYVDGVVNSMLTLGVRSPHGDPLEYALDCNPKQGTDELERRFLTFIVKHQEEYRRMQVAEAVLDFMIRQCEK